MNCRMLFLQLVRRPCSLAPARAGSRRATRITMRAMTTSNSMRVKARRWAPGRLKNRFCMVHLLLWLTHDEVAFRIRAAANVLHADNSPRQHQAVGQFVPLCRGERG